MYKYFVNICSNAVILCHLHYTLLHNLTNIFKTSRHKALHNNTHLGSQFSVKISCLNLEYKPHMTAVIWLQFTHVVLPLGTLPSEVLAC